jgi:hypothetical protein
MVPNSRSIGVHRNWPAVLVLLPAVTLVACAAVLVLAAGAGKYPFFWERRAFTMAEAAALRDRAAVLRLIRAGEDPFQAQRVPAGVLSGRELRLTPLQAAVLARRAEVVDLLLWATHGLDGEAWSDAVCLARLVHDADVEQTLRRYEPRAHSDPALAACRLPYPE